MNGLLDTCDVELADGVTIAWNGTELVCDGQPPPPPPGSVQLEVCNTFFADILIAFEVTDPPSQTLVAAGQCQQLLAPVDNVTGTVTARAYHVTDPEFIIHQCVLQDPSDGDRVVWDGEGLSCIDVVPPAAGGESLMDPVIDMAVDALHWAGDVAADAEQWVMQELGL